MTLKSIFNFINVALKVAVNNPWLGGNCLILAIKALW